MSNPADEPNSNAIVPRNERALASRSSALAQRTLADFKRLTAHREELDRLRETIQHDIDQCERALMRGASAASHLDQVCGERLPAWRRAAELGWPEGQWLLGQCFRLGLGIEHDAAQAVDLFGTAAEQGHALAQYFLGLCYLHGEGVDSDKAEAVYWFHKAAGQG
ncbi:MAG: tetratricopeptide repeat protein, partial [Candidatus Hydrogenedentota bacterium]